MINPKFIQVPIVDGSVNMKSSIACMLITEKILKMSLLEKFNGL